MKILVILHGIGRIFLVRNVDKVKHIKIIILTTFFSFIHLTELDSFNRNLGDMNEDGTINVVDVIVLVNLVLENEIYNYIGDLNNDQILNIIDIVELINIILYTPPIPENAYGSDETLDILTWNIENFPKNNNTVDTLSSIINDLYVDVIALQEIESNSSLNEIKNNLGANWTAYRSDYNSSWGELSYLINTSNVNILQPPYTILSQYEYEFAWRLPYVLKISYNNTNYTIINVHYKCCDGSEERRLESSIRLDQYISNNLSNEKVILLGDFNDLLVDNYNVFDPFLESPDEYYFVDYYISEDPSMIPYWSFPSWPSDLDHILITNEIFNLEYDASTVRIDQIFFNSFSNYDYYISDHRPVGIRITN